jgi:hypothetical protein
MMVRIHFKDIDPEGEGRDDYTFDIQVDAENKPVAGIPFFGIWGQFSDHNNCYPVLLQRNGQIDLGSQADLAAIKEDRLERFQRTNLRDRKMVLGEFVTFWVDDEEFPYKISNVQKL